MSIGVGLGIACFPDRTVTGNVEPAFNGRYEIGWHVVTASYSYRF